MTRQEQVERWNDKNPIGTPVIVWRDNGTAFATITRSLAEVSASGAPWILVKGIAGAYHLDYVRTITYPEAK